MVDNRGRGWGQLLLLVALLFGVATMHTVDHPSAGSGQGEHRPAHSTVHAVQPHAGAVADIPPVDENGPVPPMDPASVCLAVLGAWCLGLLVVRRAGSLPADPPSASWIWLPHLLRANAPLVTGGLARVPVLRI
jgi:hypothetical protein